MDETSRELAIASFSFLHENLRPVYNELRHNFLGSLIVEGAALKDLQGLNENGRHNGELITAFVAALPQFPKVANDYGRSTFNDFLTPSADVAVAVQSAVIFGEVSSSPRYLVGAHTDGRLLVADAFSDVDKEQTLAMYTPYSSKHIKKVLSALRDHVDAGTLLSSSKAIERSKYLFDPTTGLYKVNGSATDSFVMDQQRTGFANAALYPTALQRSYVSNQEFVEFSVFEHLTRLALIFDQGDSLTRVFSGNKAETKLLPPTRPTGGWLRKLMPNL